MFLYCCQLIKTEFLPKIFNKIKNNNNDGIAMFVILSNESTLFHVSVEVLFYFGLDNQIDE